MKNTAQEKALLMHIKYELCRMNESMFTMNELVKEQTLLHYPLERLNNELNAFTNYVNAQIDQIITDYKNEQATTRND